jgi:DNA modification methylase
MAKMPDNYVDLILTDPPYGINLKYDVYEDTEENWLNLMSTVIPLMKRVSKMVIMPVCRIAKLQWLYTNYPPDWLICWYKGSPGHRSYIGFNDWEPLLVYGKTRSNLAMHDFFKTRSSPKKGTFNHPCPKPIEWALHLIEKATKENDIIYDPFMGSGTTMVAAASLNRRFIGSEISEKYYEISRSRIDKELSQIKLI